MPRRSRRGHGSGLISECLLQFCADRSGRDHCAGDEFVRSGRHEVERSRVEARRRDLGRFGNLQRLGIGAVHSVFVAVLLTAVELVLLANVQLGLGKHRAFHPVQPEDEPSGFVKTPR